MWRNIQGWQLVILLVVILVLFGANRLPGAARSLGRSMRIFKSELKDLRDDDREPRAADDEQESDPQRPGGAALEGRVVDDERASRRTDTPAPGEHRPRG